MNSDADKIKIAIYDMDKTVTRRATYNGFLFHMAKKRAPWRLFLAPLVPIGLLAYALKIWSRRRLKEFSQRLMVGQRVPRADMASHLESHADMVLANNVYPQFLDRFKVEKSKQYKHIIATASYELYVDDIAGKLGFDVVIATQLVTDGGGHILAKIDGQNCYDANKLSRVKAWLAEQGLNRSNCYIRAYSDHVSDAPLLDFADEAFAVNPHEPLAKMAAAKGWEIIDWRSGG